MVKISKKIIAIIPARGGSKRLPRKNIKPINGKPMISYAIKAASQSTYVDRVIVSTDDKEIARISKKFGAEVPFIRPAELASDTATSLAVLQHTVGWLKMNEKYKPDIIVLIQPTNPLVLAEDIDGTIEELVKSRANSCLSVCEITQRPEWMYYLDNKKPKLLLGGGFVNKRSQDLPKLGIINGTVYAMKFDTLMKENKIRDEKSLSMYVMPKERSSDIDDHFDFTMAESLLKFNEEKSNQNR